MSQGSIGSYVLKIASRCNLNCTYCYMYNLADQSWRSQPKQMSPDVVRLFCSKLLHHCQNHSRKLVHLTLHGGEPLLLGVHRLDALITDITFQLKAGGVASKITIQTNGTLFTRPFGEMLRKHGISVGVSLDGPPEINDRHRVDHQGRGTSGLVEIGLRLLTEEYRDIFAGLLCVVNLNADPTKTYEYLSSFSPPTVNFLLPVDNHDRLPPGMDYVGVSSKYGDWLCAVFDAWSVAAIPSRVLFINSIINLLMGRHSLTEGFGGDESRILVIETDGSLEAVDSLKATFPGATNLGLNIREHDFDLALERLRDWARAQGLDAVPPACTACKYQRVCGSGDQATRYSAANGFRNPSIYCRDLQRIISHIAAAMSPHVRQPLEIA